MTEDREQVARRVVQRAMFEPYEDDPDATGARTPTVNIPDHFEFVHPIMHTSKDSFEPLTWVIIHRLFPKLSEEQRIKARVTYRKMRRNLSPASARRAVAYMIILAVAEQP